MSVELLVVQRDHARAEVERLIRERDEARAERDKQDPFAGKQDPFAGVYHARTPEELAEMFMNPHAPKTEAEHWAVREIEKLRAEVERLKREPELLRADLISLCNASRKALSEAYNRARITAPKEDGR